MYKLDAITAEQAECWQKILELTQRTRRITIRYCGLSPDLLPLFQIEDRDLALYALQGTEEQIRSWLIKS